MGWTLNCDLHLQNTFTDYQTKKIAHSGAKIERFHQSIANMGYISLLTIIKELKQS